ncbi:hypothetical protein EYZ11_005998 [Aspergillus tanneri]|uniref:Uncharacterized protein n=1 Tax=Aspergillus tanneri TaxID=1220188 RepID=A0A4S3JGI8_9EURO|nr:hypothetical protein EYZ11_005998 [Aspergillus tanneri]
MSNLDTEPKWLELKNQLDDDVKDDYLRLDVNLRDIPCTIDDASAMDDYRNLVIAQAGTARRAREVATALLVARFYFELDGLSPQLVHNSCWYRGTIRCKGPAKKILEALQKLYSTDADFVTDTGFLGQFGALEDCCAQCGRYVKSGGGLVGSRQVWPHSWRLKIYIGPLDDRVMADPLQPPVPLVIPGTLGYKARAGSVHVGQRRMHRE